MKYRLGKTSNFIKQSGVIALGCLSLYAGNTFSQVPMGEEKLRSVITHQASEYFGEGLFVRYHYDYKALEGREGRGWQLDVAGEYRMERIAQPVNESADEPVQYAFKVPNENGDIIGHYLFIKGSQHLVFERNFTEKKYKLQYKLIKHRDDRPEHKFRQKLIDGEALFVLTKANGEVVMLEHNGSMKRRIYQGVTTAFEYAPDKTLVRITNNKDEVLELDYDEQGRLASASGPNNKVRYYRYDNNDRLIAVLLPDDTPDDWSDNVGERYRYEDANRPELLTSITDVNGKIILEGQYDSARNLIATKTPVKNNEGAAMLVSTWNTGMQVTRRNGKLHGIVLSDGSAVTSVRDMDAEVRAARERGEFITHREWQREGSTCTACLVKKEQTYSHFSHLTSLVETYADGRVTTNSYAPYTVLTAGDGPLVEKTVMRNDKLISRAKYNGDMYDNLVVTQETPTLKREYQYDGDGNQVGELVSDSQGVTLQEYANTYNDEGLMTVANGPRIDVDDITTYEYNEAGKVTKQTNALGHETRYEYNAEGKRTATITPNGMRNTVVYDDKGNVITRTRAQGTSLEAQTSYSYDSQGRLVSMVYPDGRSNTRSYNEDGQLASVADQDGNSTVYTYDERGNRTATHQYDGDSNLINELHTAFDEYDRQTSINGSDVAYTYTGNSAQPEQIATANGMISQEYNDQGQLTQTTDTSGGQTAYTYNAQGQVKTVTDPRGVITQYRYDALGRQTQLISPSTGTSTFTFDEAGNQIRERKENGIVIKRKFDALNRLTREVHKLGDVDKKVRTLTYDTCTNGMGRLCKIKDETSATHYDYDVAGNITKVKERFDGETLTTKYQYHANGQLLSVTYPSKLKVKYHYNAKGQVKRITAKRNGETFEVMAGMKYRGINKQLSKFSWGNGLSAKYAYNDEGQIAKIKTSKDDEDNTVIQQLNYRYDEAGNITRIAQPNRAEYTQTFNYDALSRLTKEKRGESVTTYSYDAVGNRLSKKLKVDGETDENKTYTYQDDANRLIAIKGKELTYDVNGNLLADKNGKRKFEYNATNRLTAFYKNDQLKAMYAYNHKNQRVKKTLYRATEQGDDYKTLHVSYLPTGWLQTETGKNSANQTTFYRDYIWLGDKPIAQVQTRFKANGEIKGEHILYIHTDHLNTPRLATNTNQDIVWRWDSEAFGHTKADRDPDGDGNKVNVRLRFPGQYYDRESNLYYNHHRDYDPSIGRYIQSDPIGLNGGINTYGYVLQNPVSKYDPAGLLAFVLVIPAIEFGITVTGVDLLIGGLIAAVLSLEGDSATVEINATQSQINAGLPTTDECKTSERNYCATQCGGSAKVNGCYVSIKWTIQGVRNGELIRSEERTVNCNCDDSCP